MADKASKFDPKEIADVAQNTLRKFTSLDTPQDMTAAETAADIAAGFVPGVGTAQSARDFERARREGDKLGMGLSAVGMVPVVGGVVKPAKVAARSLGDLVDQYVRRVRKMEELGPAGYSVHKVEAPASSEVPGWHISQDLPGILSTGAMTNKAVGANNIQGWVPAHVGGAYFYSDPRLARAKWEDLADVVGDPKLAAEMPVIRAQLRRGNRLVPDEDVSLSVPWQQSYQEGSFATKRPVLINQIDRIYSADPSVTKDMIRDTIIRQRRYAAGGAVDFEKGGKAEFDPKEIANVAEQTLKKFISLDTPQDMSSAETVADIAAGFVPGIGTAQSARDFERARREGDKLGMGLSAVGMIPVVGGVVKPARKAVDPLAEMLRKYLDKAPSTPSRAAEMRSVQEALARTESRAADAASARQTDILSSPETYKEVDWPQRFYRGIRQATRGPNGEVLPEVSSLIMPQRGSEVLAVQPNNPRRTAWAASNPLTASSFASDPNSLVVPLRLREKPDVVFNAEGLPWQRFFSQTGDLSRGSYNYPLRSEFKDMLRDPSVRSILVKDIFDDAANTPEGLRRLSELYGVQLRPENLLSDNLLIKDPSVVEYLLTKETPKMTESLKSKSSPKSSSKKEPTVKEQKMLQGFYRGYAGEPDVAGSVFVTPQRAVGEYYGAKRAAQTGAEPHLEMILADPFAGRGYGHSTMGTGKNPPMITRARELAPEDVKSRTKLYAEGGAVADTDPNALVTQAYRDILQRDPEQEGLQYWTNQLSTNQLTPESLYQNIAAAAQGADAPNAQRYANALQNRNLVTQAYQDILQRAPEQEGLSYWTGQLNTGALTPETLRQNILASAQGADAAKAQQYAQNFAATQPQPTEAVDPDSYRNPYNTRRTLDDLASIYSIGRYFIPGMQLAAPIDLALRALSLGNTAKKIGKIFRFAAGGPVNYDPAEIDTIVSRVKEELHG